MKFSLKSLRIRRVIIKEKLKEILEEILKEILNEMIKEIFLIKFKSRRFN